MYTVYVIGGTTSGHYDDATRSKYARHEWEEAFGHVVPSDYIYYSMVDSGSSAKGQSIQWRGKWARRRDRSPRPRPRPLNTSVKSWSDTGR